MANLEPQMFFVGPKMLSVVPELQKKSVLVGEIVIMHTIFFYLTPCQIHLSWSFP